MNWNIIKKRKSKQNITGDIEIKNMVTIATGKWGEDSGGRVVHRSYCTGHKDKIKGDVRVGGGRLDLPGEGGIGRKSSQL